MSDLPSDARWNGASRIDPALLDSPAMKSPGGHPRLDMPFSTYRRHLRAGVQFVTERLWQLELSAAA